MTLHVYGFLEIVSQVDPGNAGIAAVGELSPYGKTFVPADGTYPWVSMEAGVLDTSLHHIMNDDSAWDNDDDVTLSAVRPLLTAINTKISGTALHTGTAADISTTPLATAWVGSLLDGPISGGSIIVNTATGVAAIDLTNNTVQYIQITVTQSITGKQFVLKLWLADALFITEYPLGYFNVVPPIPNPLDFINNFATSKVVITNRTIDKHMDNAQTFLLGKVNTGIEIVTLRVYDVTNNADYFDCPFFVGYNGKSGVTYGGLIDAIAGYLRSLGGGFNLEDWVEAIPQLNNLGVYYVIPTWDNVAIPNPNIALPAIMYSPQHSLWNVDNIYTNVEAAYFDTMYGANEVRSLLEYGVSSFKSIGFFVMPDPQNENNTPVSFGTKFADFIVANINTLDSTGVSVVTENLIRDLHMLLQQAEVYVNTVTTLPADYAAEEVNGFIYITLANPFGRAKLYVLTKEAYTTEV